MGIEARAGLLEILLTPKYQSAPEYDINTFPKKVLALK